MSQTFTHYENLWAKTRDSIAGKPLQNNTRLYKRADDCFAIRLHDTDVVTVFADDSVVLSTGGWYTVTTKDRISSYAPVQMQSDRGVWYVIHSEARKRAEVKARKEFGVPLDMAYAHDHFHKGATWGTPEYKAETKLYRNFYKRQMELCRVPFFDGIRFTKAGRCTNGITPARWSAYLAERNAMTKWIQDYCTGFNRRMGTIAGIPFKADAILEDLGCVCGEQETFTPKILTALMVGKHYVPSLAYEAVEAKGYSDLGVQMHLRWSYEEHRIGGPRFQINDGSMGGNLVRRAIRDYLFDRLLPQPPSLRTDTDSRPIRSVLTNY